MQYQNIVAVWKKKDKNGNAYLSMKVERDLKAGDSVNIFANDKKGVEKRPDFRAYEKIEDDVELPDELANPQKKNKPLEEQEHDTDDIPF